jgi:hypothetical protein
MSAVAMTVAAYGDSVRAVHRSGTHNFIIDPKTRSWRTFRIAIAAAYRRYTRSRDGGIHQETWRTGMTKKRRTYLVMSKRD